MGYAITRKFSCTTKLIEGTSQRLSKLFIEYESRGIVSRLLVKFLKVNKEV